MKRLSDLITKFSANRKINDLELFVDKTKDGYIILKVRLKNNESVEPVHLAIFSNSRSYEQWIADAAILRLLATKKSVEKARSFYAGFNGFMKTHKDKVKKITTFLFVGFSFISLCACSTLENGTLITDDGEHQIECVYRKGTEIMCKKIDKEVING